MLSYRYATFFFFRLSHIFSQGCAIFFKYSCQIFLAMVAQYFLSVCCSIVLVSIV